MARSAAKTEIDDRELALGHVYSRAVLELAEEAGVADDLREELEGLAEVYRSDGSFRDFLVNPAIDADERRDSLERLFRGRLSDLAVDALQVLNRKGRSALLPAVVEAYRQDHDRLRDRVEVRVTSARPLADEQRQRLAATVRERTGREASFVERVDPSILGGLVVQIGDEKTDGSVATKLRNLGEALLDRASREIHSGTNVEGTAT